MAVCTLVWAASAILLPSCKGVESVTKGNGLNINYGGLVAAAASDSCKLLKLVVAAAASDSCKLARPASMNIRWISATLWFTAFLHPSTHEKIQVKIWYLTKF